MRAYEILQEAPITNTDPESWGLTPVNRSITYFGLKVLMRPSKFLALALPLTDSTTNPDVLQHVEKGGNIASPFLSVRIPEDWFNDPPDFLRAARVTGHEGRNRMTSWLNKFGDDPVEIHIEFRDGLRRRDITDLMIKQLQRHMINQAGDKVIVKTFERVIED